MPTVTTYFVIAFGGALGTLARYALSVVGLPYSRELPLATIAIHITGSFVIEFFGTLTLATGRFPVSENLRLFVMVGLCGGYTTFSAFSLQTFDLLRAGTPVRAMANVSMSVALCVGAVALGHALASQINAHAYGLSQIAEKAAAIEQRDV